jgi:hypothetical protein
MRARPPAFQDSLHRVESAHGLREVRERGPAEEKVEPLTLKGHIRGAAVEKLGSYTSLRGAFLRDLDKSLGDIQSSDPVVAQLRQFGRKIPRTWSDFENLGPWSEQFRETAGVDPEVVH